MNSCSGSAATPPHPEPGALNTSDDDTAGGADEKTRLDDLPIAGADGPGLVVGKTIGILGAAALVSRLTRARLDPNLRWVDILGVASLAGIGFTVSLLTGTVLAGAISAAILRIRNRAYRRIEAAEQVDDDHDGIPDVYQQPRS